MVEIKCPECKRKINENVEKCPYCGKEITGEVRAAAKYDKMNKEKRSFIIIIVSIVFIVAIAVITYFYYSKQKAETLEKEKQVEQEQKEKEQQEQQKKISSDDFYSNVADFKIISSQLYEDLFSYNYNRKKVWYNCVMRIDDATTDLYTKDEDGNFLDDFNEALNNWSESDTTENKAAETFEKEIEIYNKIYDYEPVENKERELKELVESLHEIAIKILQYETGYGYSYSEYDEKTEEDFKIFSDLLAQLIVKG